MAPPSTMIPSGAPRIESHGGNRFLQRDDQGIANRREAEDRQNDKIDKCKPPSDARKARWHQQEAPAS
jgi:hypothetical protein